MTTTPKPHAYLGFDDHRATCRCGWQSEPLPHEDGYALALHDIHEKQAALDECREALRALKECEHVALVDADCDCFDRVTTLLARLDKESR